MMMGVMQVTCQEERKGKCMMMMMMIIIITIIKEGRGGKGWQETVTFRIKNQTQHESCHLRTEAIAFIKTRQWLNPDRVCLVTQSR